MEKRRYDQDEMLIRQVLKDAYPQNFNIIEGIDAKIMPKRILAKGFIAAIAAASLMIVSVAAAYYMGSFERLAAIIGEERAGELTPLEITSVTDASTSLDDANDAQSTQYSEIAIELVAIEVSGIEVSGHAAYIYFTMKDLVANRLDGDFFIMHHIIPAEPIDGFISLTGPPEIIHRNVNGTVTFRSRFEHNYPLEGIGLNYTIRAISFNEFYHHPQIVDINLSDFAFDAPAVLFQTSHPMLGAGGPNPEEITARYAEIITGEGLPVLAPNTLNIGFGLDRVQSVISGIGVVNGRLHIQVYNPDRAGSDVHLWIIHESGINDLTGGGYEWTWSIVNDLFSTQFGVDEDGILYSDIIGVTDTMYFETVYEIDLENIHEYVLVVSARGAERIDIGWDAAFDLDDAGLRD